MILLNKVFDYIGWINEWVGKITHPLILVMSLVVFTEILFRNLLNLPTIWSFEVTIFLFAICSLMSGGILLKHNAHINVDIVISRFSQKWQIICKIICFPFFLLFAGCMVYFGWSFFWASILSLETTGSAWDPYIFPIKIFLPLGATLLLLQGIVNIVRDIERVFFPKKAEAVVKEDFGSF